MATSRKAPARTEEGEKGDESRYALLRAMEMRLDSLTSELNRLEQKQASLERTVELLAGRTAAWQEPDDSPLPDSAFFEEPAPEVDLEVRRRKGIWVSILLALVIGAVIVFGTALVGIGEFGSWSLPSSDDLSFEAIGSREWLSVWYAISWINWVLGAGVAVLLGAGMVAARVRLHRRRMSA
jgi:hypothetical protein